ncbi:hypothetical protein FAEPRAM212_03019 [Faecalibacterium prausnitzii M21/2]|uniref:Uncharacterized protein n=1 Tax=Faecalibacterium prausnitzii M21/2 TaxID=411485 RepID=A8SGC2_9FIRM|nr:hypothetical protein FAEPRAM212_03019 [Faecalibacterium prausnitzii M21/2]
MVCQDCIKIFSAIQHYARKLPADLCGVYLKNMLY